MWPSINEGSVFLIGLTNACTEILGKWFYKGFYSIEKVLQFSHLQSKNKHQIRALALALTIEEVLQCSQPQSEGKHQLGASAFGLALANEGNAHK